VATGDVLRWESRRGRNHEFDEIEAGTATIWLNNRHGKYDPTWGAGPYSGKLLPLKQSVITAAKPTTPTTFVRQFTGFVEDWDFERRGPRHGIAVLQLVDGFEPLSRAEIAPSMKGGAYFASARADDRQRAALADAGWPAAWTQINTSNVDVQPVLYPAGTSALEVCRDAAEAEFPGVGMVFMRKDGVYRFTGRCARFNQTAPLYRLGDAGAMLLNPTLIPIFDVKWSYEKEHIYNKVLILPEGVEPKDGYVKQDAASIVKHGPRWLPPITDLLIQTGTTTGNTGLVECTDVFARYYVENFRRPYVRARGLELRASFADASAAFLDPLWNFMLNVELGDLIELNTIHPTAGGMNAMTFYVEGISNEVEPPYRWRQLIDLSPKQRFDQRLYLGC